MIDGEGTLVEFHVTAAEARHVGEAYEVVEKSGGVRRVLAQSFDPTLMSIGRLRPGRVRTVGWLFREIADPGFSADAAITVRAAASADVAALLRLGADFFDGPAEIENYIASDGLMIYEARGGVPLGAGVMKRVVAARNDVDIGMVVAPEHRRRGHGAYIVGHLKAHCLARGLRPICGCAIDNLASQRTLERAGFVSRHELIEFEL